jgi:biotin carboxylase
MWVNNRLQRIEHTTIEKILEMDEIELALAVLLGEIKLPQ